MYSRIYGFNGLVEQSRQLRTQVTSSDPSEVLQYCDCVFLAETAGHSPPGRAQDRAAREDGSGFLG